MFFRNRTQADNSATDMASKDDPAVIDSQLDDLGANEYTDDDGCGCSLNPEAVELLKSFRKDQFIFPAGQGPHVRRAFWICFQVLEV